MGEEWEAPGFLMIFLNSRTNANDSFCLDGLSVEEKNHFFLEQSV